MKRVVRSKSGREIYGPKWHNNIEYSNISQASAPVSTATEPPSVDKTSDVRQNEDQTQSSQGIKYRRGIVSDRHYSMYRACIEGDCVAAEMLLEGDSDNLASDEISEEGDRALHVAATMKHEKLVRKLVERMRPSELVLLDGQGYTACCYAAISGSVEIADFMMRKNPTLATARDMENKTPLQKAASRGNANMVSHFLKSVKAEHLSTQEWFDLLLVTIRRGIYGVGLEILGIKEQLATMSNDEGTALHLLAKQRFYMNRWQRINGVMRREMRFLAEKLLAGVHGVGESSAVELMKYPSILHNAAEVGNVELITMITQTYPHLACLTDTRGYTIFHVAVICRHEVLFGLINEIGAKKDLIAVSLDENGNNILHLLGDLVNPERLVLRMPSFEMQRELLWFEKLKEIVPPLCLTMKNKEGKTPEELFLKGHKSLLEESRTWMRNVADSCMLISTLIFTVVFGSAFAAPGGYNQVTGIPILSGKIWFMFFVMSEALAMLSSALSIFCFLRIMMTDMTETDFARRVPRFFVWGLNALSFSVLAAVSVFMSAYFLVYVERRTAPVPVLFAILIVVIHVAIVSGVCTQIYLFRISLPKHMFRRHTRHNLFKKSDVVMPTKTCRFWLF